jgi:DNA-binding PadR family transcriptional regulator
LSPPVFNVLLALGEQTLHGYAIMRRFEELTGGAEEILPGTLYVTLGRMIESGLIEEVKPPAADRSGGPPRRHYRITNRGRAAALAETERLRHLLQVARRQAWVSGNAR